MSAAITMVAVGAAACATGDPAQQQAANARSVPYLGANPAPSAELSWGDDLIHLVVTTAGAPAGPARARYGVVPNAGDDSGAKGGPFRGIHVSRDQNDLEFTLHRSDGTTETVTIPAGSMTAVVVLPDERAAVDAAGAGAAVVVDVGGLLGAPGERYVLARDQLVELGAAGDGVGAATTDDTDTPLVIDSGSAGDDDVITAYIAGLDGVVHVDVVGPGIIAVSGDPGAAGLADQIAAVDGVTAVQDDILLGYADDTYQSQQWALANTGSASQTGGRYVGVAGADVASLAAWTITKGLGVVVAVIDSGVELAHPDLSPQLWTNAGEANCTNGVDDDHNGFVDDCAGWDFGNNDKNPVPDSGATNTEHGTHVAGIIAAAQNGMGVVGVAPGAKIMPLKVGNSSGGISGSSVAGAINYATANGAKVVNMSLATSPGTPRAAASPIENAINAATAAGVVVVVAAGNDGIDISSAPGWPAGYSLYNSGVITVGANTNSDTRAGFSNTGTPLTIQAPGYWIVSTVIGGWAYMSGTSMASPSVAGGAALVVASGTATTPAAVRSRLVATAETTAGGKRMNVAFAVGTTRAGGTVKTTSVSYSGTNTLVADADGRLTVVVAANAASAINRVRLSVATRDGSNIAAVEGLAATFADTSAAIGTMVTNDEGAFPFAEIRDTAALQSGGAALNVGMNLPAGEYAFVTELIDASGAAVNGAQVAYLSVSFAPSNNPGAIPATTVSTSPIITAPSSSSTTPTTHPSGPSTSASSTDGSGGGAGSGGSAGGSGSATTLATTAPGSGSGSGGSGGATATTAAPATTSPGTPSATTAPSSGATRSPSTSVSTSPSTISPSTTSPSTTSPATATPSTTTAATASTVPATELSPLPGASDGAYAVSNVSPRTSTVCGGDNVTVSGKFPVSGPIYVWFGGAVARPGSSNGTSFTLRVPANVTANVVDIVLKFRMGRQYVITVSHVFTYTPSANSCWGGPTTTAPGGSGGPGESGGTTSSTIAGTTPTPAPSSTAPAPSSTVPAPATSSPATTSAPAITAPAKAVTGTRGRLTLRSISAGALTSLRAGMWPVAGCRDANCGASSL